jgi:hypothetical protein
VINNSGSWLDQNAFVTQISNDFGGAQSTFDNTGTYTKSGDATTTVDILFNNASSGGGTSNGSFFGTGTLQFSGGTHTLAAASSITLPNVTVSGGTVNHAGSYTVTGTTTVTGGTANFTGAVTNNVGAALVVSGGTANFSNAAPVVFSTINLSGSGTVAGTQTVTSSGVLTWTGGEMTGSPRRTPTAASPSAERPRTI